MFYSLLRCESLDIPHSNSQNVCIKCHVSSEVPLASLFGMPSSIYGRTISNIYTYVVISGCQLFLSNSPRLPV